MHDPARKRERFWPARRRASAAGLQPEEPDVMAEPPAAVVEESLVTVGDLEKMAPLLWASGDMYLEEIARSHPDASGHTRIQIRPDLGQLNPRVRLWL